MAGRFTAVHCRSRANTVRVNAREDATLQLDEGVEGGADYSGLLAGEQHFHPTHAFSARAHGGASLTSCTMHANPWQF